MLKLSLAGRVLLLFNQNTRVYTYCLCNELYLLKQDIHNETSAAWCAAAVAIALVSVITIVGSGISVTLSTVKSLKPRGETSATWWAAAVAMSVVTVTTVVGNAAVLAALRRAHRAPAHYPLASLASADLLVGLFVLPVAAARELFVFHLNWAICSSWSTLDVLCCTASILSICTLGWERWCGITAPLARAKRAKRARLYAALVWPIATAVALPTAFIPSPRHFHPGEVAKACTVNTNVGYVFFSAIFSFYLPAGVMVTLYTRILNALAARPPIRAHRGRSPCPEITQGSPSSPTKGLSTPANAAGEKPVHSHKVIAFLSPKGRHLNLPNCSSNQCTAANHVKTSASPGYIISRQRRATRTIVMLMALFLFCWTPFFVMLPADSLCECVWDTAWQWCTWLGYGNSALNPLVYAAASPSVRRALHASLSSRTASTSARAGDVPLAPSASPARRA